jgi:hypothetical protein
MKNALDTQIAVTVLSNSAQTLAALRSLTTWADDLYLAYAWASSDRGRAEHWGVLPIRKIRKAVIGVHFAQTEPFVLEALSKRRDILRVVEDTAGVYHPKVIVGTKGDNAIALLGSSNFTLGGFAGNTELNVLLEGPHGNPALSEIIKFVEALWSAPRSIVPNSDWIALYTTAYKQRQHPQPVPRPASWTPIVARQQDLDVGWSEYYALIKAQDQRILANRAQIYVFDHPASGSYLEEAEASRRLFEMYPVFRAMPSEAREHVAGFGRSSSGYFGRMAVAGKFVALVSADPQALGQFLDPIPLAGDISLEQVKNCLTGLTSQYGVSLGAASRLLCMKRQDRFVPYNSANLARIREIFGRARWSIAGYLDLHERIWSFQWFRTTEPEDENERRVWHARVALLDSIVYEATSTAGAPPGFRAPR